MRGELLPGYCRRAHSPQHFGLSGDLGGCQRFSDPAPTEDFIDLAASDARELGELAVRKVFGFVKAHADDLAGLALGLTGQGFVDSIGKLDGDRHAKSITRLPSGLA